MLTLQVEKICGCEYEINESLDEFTYRDYEILFKHISMEEFDTVDYLKEAYGIPKKCIRQLPRILIDLIATAIYKTTQEMNELPEIEEEPISNLPYYRWLDLEFQMQKQEGIEWLKYLMVIRRGDYDLSEDPEYLNREANKLLDTPVKEALVYLTFFIVTDPSFSNLFYQSIPSKRRLKLLPPEHFQKGWSKSMAALSKSMMLPDILEKLEPYMETIQESETPTPSPPTSPTK